MDEELLQKSVLIIGAGGIGTTVVDLLVPALARIELGAKITLMDGDVVEYQLQEFRDRQVATDIKIIKE